MVRQEIGIRKKKDKKSEDVNMGFGDWGGYMAAKRAKLLDQFYDAKIEVISNIFERIAIHVNGLTKPPIDTLKNLMAAHGGLFHEYQTANTTHIIASNLANVKIKKLGSIPIVKPSWIIDSIDMGKLLDYKRYLLYTNQSPSQPALQFPITSNSHSNIMEDTLNIKKKKVSRFEIPSNGSDENNEVLNISKLEFMEFIIPEKNNMNGMMKDNVKRVSDKITHGNENSSNAYNTSMLFSSPTYSVKGNRLHDDQPQIDLKKSVIPERVQRDDKCLDKQLNCRSRTATKTASDPNFLEEFYNNSRLHLISTLGAEYKQLVNQLREKSNGTFPGIEKLKGKGKIIEQNLSESVIMHIDMDCFFVSVGLRNRPELKGKPIAIAHARNGELKNISVEQKLNREKEYGLYNEKLPVGVTSLVDKIDTLSSMSEIASCSYEARRFGVRNGMFLGQAVKMCPDLKMLPYDFEGYKEVSRTLYNIIALYTLDIEAVSCDEMYVDITKLLKETGLSVEEWADYIRNEITIATGCPCSTGFGSNRLRARLATRKAKPAGKFYLKSQDIKSFMAKIPLDELPGVGRATLVKLRNLGLNTCGDIQVSPLKMLQNEIGQKFGETLKEQSMGIDRKPLNFSHERKSVSAEVNFGIRFKSLEECHNFLQNLSIEVHKRLSSINMKARCVTLKLLVRSADAPLETAKFLGHGICDSLSKSSVSMAINDSQAIYNEVLSLYNKINPCVTDLRGIGIQLSKLEKISPFNSILNNFLKQPSKVKISKENIDEKSEESLKTKSKLNPYLLDLGEGTSTGKGKIKSDCFGNTLNVDTLNSCSDNCSIDTYCLLNFKQKDIHKSNIDSEILKKLPEVLRGEVTTYYTFKEPEELRHINLKRTISNRGTDHGSSPFSRLNWEEMKPLIKSWATSGEKPQEVDVIIIGKCFKAYAIDRKIELLFTVVNSLHRVFVNLPCEWHKAYFTILNIAQEGMMARYGNMLMVNRTFKCCNI